MSIKERHEATVLENCRKLYCGGNITR